MYASKGMPRAKTSEVRVVEGVNLNVLYTFSRWGSMLVGVVPCIGGVPHHACPGFDIGVDLEGVSSS